MNIKVTTVNKSVYILREQEMTWERIESSEESGTLRTHGGSIKPPFTMPEEGKPMYLSTDIIEGTGAYARLIITSKVDKIEEF